ncbi:MAG: hypothetical protein ACLQBD_19880 [Syntrophobacteraceae bacterium]
MSLLKELSQFQVPVRLVDERVAERGKLPGTFIIVKERLAVKEQYGLDIISSRETLYKE